MTNLTDVLNPSTSGSGPGPSDATPAVSGATTNPPVATADNPRGYPPFELRLVPTYTNRQLRHYHVSGAMLDVDKEELKRKMDDRKEILDLVSWDGNTRENTPEASTSLISSSPPPPPPPHSVSRTLSLDADSEEDSECPEPPPGYRGLKLNNTTIPLLKYTSTVAQFNNWLEDL
jgi:hypothetical protein